MLSKIFGMVDIDTFFESSNYSVQSPTLEKGSDASVSQLIKKKSQKRKYATNTRIIHITVNHQHRNYRDFF